MQCAVLLAQVPVLEVELSLTSTAFRNEKDRKARPQLNRSELGDCFSYSADSSIVDATSLIGMHVHARD